MAVFSVSYDLNKQDKNYEGLYTALKKTEYNHIMDSTWLVSTTEDAQQIYERLRTQLDSNDYLFMSKVNKGEYYGWLKRDIWDWIVARL